MKRNSKISGKEVFEVVDILQPDRLIEPQLANALRELEMSLQKGNGNGHGLVGIFTVEKP